MDFQQISRALLPLLGGKENIASAAHCATRLRLVLVDDALADQQAIGKVEGVKGCFRNAGQMQIIFGTGVVNKVYAALFRRPVLASRANPKPQIWRRKTESVPAYRPPVVEHLCAHYPGYRRLRPADGTAGDGENLRLGRSGQRHLPDPRYV